MQRDTRDNCQRQAHDQSAQREAAMQARTMRELMMPEHGITIPECRWDKR